MTSTSSVAEPRPAKLDFGRVIQTTFGVLGRNFGVFLLLAIVVSALPLALMGYGAAVASSGFTGQVFNPEAFGLIGLGGLLAFLANVVLQAGVMYGAVTDLRGQKASFADCFQAGLANILPLIGIGILWVLALMLSWITIVGPFILMCMWFVAVPAQVAERTGVIGAFGRSRRLTKGSRWRIFGLLILYVIVSSVVQQALVTAAGGPINLAAGSPTPSIPGLAVSTVISVLNALVAATGTAAIYFELRRVKEGLGAEELAALFD